MNELIVVFRAFVALFFAGSIVLSFYYALALPREGLEFLEAYDRLSDKWILWAIAFGIAVLAMK